MVSGTGPTVVKMFAVWQIFLVTLALWTMATILISPVSAASHSGAGYRTGVSYERAGSGADQSFVGKVFVPGSDLRYHNDNGQSSFTLTNGAGRGKGQGRHCYKYPMSSYYNISNKSYYYPKNNIYQELGKRKDILEQIFKDGVKALDPKSEPGRLYQPSDEDLQSRVGSNVLLKPVYQGCTSYRLLLRSFDMYNGHCWVVYPRHQALSFVSCGTPRCQSHSGYGQFSACFKEERVFSVWAWCETLPYGKRITKIDLPLPVDCRCEIFDC